MFRNLHAFAAAALSLILAMAATPSAAQTVEWRGFAYLSDFNAACASVGWSGTSQVNARFRPSGLGSNGASSRLSFFNDFYAMNFVLPTGRFVLQWRDVQGAGLGSTTFLWPDGTRLRLTSMTPNNAALTATTPQIRLVGQFQGLDTAPTCTGRFEATLIRAR